MEVHGLYVQNVSALLLTEGRHRNNAPMFLGDTYNDVITTCFLYHIRYEFRRDWGAALVLLVLSCIREKRDDGRYPFSTCNLAGMDHDAKLHEGCVDCPAASIDNVHIILANALCDADACLANAALGHVSFCKR